MPAWVITAITLVVVAVGIAIAYRMYAHAAHPGDRAREVSALTMAARNDLYGDAFNEDVFMRPGPVTDRGWSRSTTRASTASSTRTGRTGRRDIERIAADCRPASPAPTRCRCSPAPPWWSPPSWRCNCGERALMPWLTVLWAVPMSAPRGDPAAARRARTRQVVGAASSRWPCWRSPSCWRSVRARRARSTSSSNTTPGYRRSAPATSSAWTASRWCWWCSPRSWCRC